MVKSEWNPAGIPIEVFDGLRSTLAANRAQFYIDFPTGPFYGFNRPGAKSIQGLIDNWWRQGMMGSASAQYECIKAFSETDFREDLKTIKVPVLVAHGTDDQIVPYPASAPFSIKLLKHGTLKTYEGFSAWHAVDEPRDTQSCTARVLQVMNGTAARRQNPAAKCTLLVEW